MGVGQVNTGDEFLAIPGAGGTIYNRRDRETDLQLFIPYTRVLQPTQLVCMHIWFKPVKTARKSSSWNHYVLLCHLHWCGGPLFIYFIDFVGIIICVMVDARHLFELISIYFILCLGDYLPSTSMSHPAIMCQWYTTSHEQNHTHISMECHNPVYSCHVIGLAACFSLKPTLITQWIRVCLTLVSNNYKHFRVCFNPMYKWGVYRA